MSQSFNKAAWLDALLVKATGMERRRCPRYEAMGPGELRRPGGESLGRLRLLDESESGMGCISPAAIAPGETVEVRIAGAERWRPAVVIDSVDCGQLRRLCLSYSKPAGSNARAA